MRSSEALVKRDIFAITVIIISRSLARVTASIFTIRHGSQILQILMAVRVRGSVF